MEESLDLLSLLYDNHNIHFADKAERRTLEKDIADIIGALPFEASVCSLTHHPHHSATQHGSLAHPRAVCGSAAGEPSTAGPGAVRPGESA